MGRAINAIIRAICAVKMSSLDAASDLLTLADPLVRDVAMFGFCLFLADVVAKSHWGSRGGLQSFGMLLVVAFGGGFLAPILLSMDQHFPYPLANDRHFLVCLAAWAVRNQVPAWEHAYSRSKLARAGVGVLFELLRARTLWYWWSATAAAIPASQFSAPLFGPIVIGGLGGCGGLVFLQGRDFLAAPLNPLVASALAGSMALTLLTTGLLGKALAMAGTGVDPASFTISVTTCHACVAAYFVQTRLVAVLNAPEPKKAN